MKKTLIALAALATTAAFAQSSVSMTGRLDMGLVQNKTTNTVAGTATETKVTDLTGNQNGRTTSRLTFAGVEDLGGGLSARFNFETGLNPSDDAGLFAGSTRNGSISLVTGVGAFSIGTFTSNAIDGVRGLSAATYSIGGGDFLANTASGKQFKDLSAALGVTVPASLTLGLPGRSRNAVAYSGQFGAISASLGLHQQKNVTPNTKTTGSILGLGYASGPLTARLAIGSAKSSNTLTGDTNGKNSDVALGGSYNFGMVVPYAVYEAVKLSVPGADPIKANAFEVGARFPLGAFTPYVTLATGNHKVGGDKIAKSSGLQVGTTYDLSKRTYLYGAVGQDKVKGVDLGVEANTKRSSFIAGVVHSF